MNRYICLVCGFMYEEEYGWEGDAIAPGTKWKDVPDHWCCPTCGSTKHDFEMLEA